MLSSVAEALDALLNKMEENSKAALAALRRLEEKVNQLPLGHEAAKSNEEQVMVCQACEMERPLEDMEGEKCYLCLQYPCGSYSWHLASYMGKDVIWDQEKADAFRSGWLRALYELRERLTTIAMGRVIEELELEAE